MGWHDHLLGIAAGASVGPSGEEGNRLPYRDRFSGLIRRDHAVQRRHSLDYLKLSELGAFPNYTIGFRGSVW